MNAENNLVEQILESVQDYYAQSGSAEMSGWLNEPLEAMDSTPRYSFELTSIVLSKRHGIRELDSPLSD